MVGVFCCRTSNGVIEFGRDWNGGWQMEGASGDWLCGDNNDEAMCLIAREQSSICAPRFVYTLSLIRVPRILYCKS